MLEVEHIGVRITGNIQPLVTALDAAKTAIRTGVVDLQKAAAQMTAAFTTASVQNIAAMTRMQTATINSTAQIAAAHTKAGATVAVAANTAATAVNNSAASVVASQGRAAAAATTAAAAVANANAKQAASATQSQAQQTRANTMLQSAMNAYANAQNGATDATKTGAEALGGFNIFAFRIIRSMLQMAGASSASANAFATMATNMSALIPLLPAIIAGLGLLLAAVLAIKVIKWGVGLAAEAETARTAFGVFLGSAEAAVRVANELRDLANTTPLSQQEVLGAAKQLFAFGEDAKRVSGTLRMLGDIASGIGQPLQEIADLYGRMRVQGRLFAVDINQLTNRGIPVIHALAQQFGVADTAIRGMVEEGEVHFSHLEKAMQSMTAEGGLFHGMMEALSKTLNGRLSTLKDAFAELGRSIGGVFLPMVSAVVSGLISVLNTINAAIKTSKAFFEEWASSLSVQIAAATVAMVALGAATQYLIVAAVAAIPFIISGLSAIVIALWNAVAATAALVIESAPLIWPWLLIGAAVTAVLYGIYKLWQWVAGNELQIKAEFDEKGLIKVESLKAILEADGEQAKQLRGEFGKTNEQLLAMGVAGQLSGDRVKEALAQAADVAKGLSAEERNTAKHLREHLAAAQAVALQAEAAAAKLAEQQKARREMYTDVEQMEQKIAWMRAGYSSDEIADLKAVEEYKKKVNRGDGSRDVQRLKEALAAMRQASADRKQLEDDEKARQDQIKKDWDEWDAHQQKLADNRNQRFNDQRKEGEELAKSMRTPMEKFRAEHQRFSDMLARGDIEMDTYTKAMQDLRKEFDEEMKLNINVDAVDALVGGTIEAMDILNGLSTHVGKGVQAGVPAPLALSSQAVPELLLAPPTAPRPGTTPPVPQIPMPLLDPNAPTGLDPAAELDRLRRLRDAALPESAEEARLRAGGDAPFPTIRLGRPPERLMIEDPNRPQPAPDVPGRFDAAIPAQQDGRTASAGAAGRNMMGESPTQKGILETLKQMLKNQKQPTSNTGPNIEFIEGALV